MIGNRLSTIGWDRQLPHQSGSCHSSLCRRHYARPVSLAPLPQCCHLFCHLPRATCPSTLAICDFCFASYAMQLQLQLVFAMQAQIVWIVSVWRVTHLDLRYATGQIRPQMFQGANQAIHQFGIIASTLLNIRSCRINRTSKQYSIT